MQTSFVLRAINVSCSYLQSDAINATRFLPKQSYLHRSWVRQYSCFARLLQFFIAFAFSGLDARYLLSLAQLIRKVIDGVLIVRKEEIGEFIHSYLLYLDTAEKR